MAAGISDHIWTIGDVTKLIDYSIPNFEQTSRLILTLASAAWMASLLWTSGSVRTVNVPE